MREGERERGGREGGRERGGGEESKIIDARNVDATYRLVYWIRDDVSKIIRHHARGIWSFYSHTLTHYKQGFEIEALD